MNKKYKFTGETKKHEGITLHQIQALRSFDAVEEGDVGGWIEKEENLSHESNCWVNGDAWVYGNAGVCGDALVCGDTWVNGDTRVNGDIRNSSDNLPEELNTLPESIEEVTIKGVKYRKVTKWERA